MKLATTALCAALLVAGQAAAQSDNLADFYNRENQRRFDLETQRSDDQRRYEEDQQRERWQRLQQQNSRPYMR